MNEAKTIEAIWKLKKIERPVLELYFGFFHSKRNGQIQNGQIQNTTL